jgi:amidophosphoribosyltransferase
VCSSIGADSLGYISEEGMVAATEQPASVLCTACFTGRYPVELPHESRLGKNLFETLPIDVDVDGVSLGLGGGAADALTRP